MGMFDYVEFKMTCPICKAEIDDFQTKSAKDGGKFLRYIPVDFIADGGRFYSSCHKCKTSVEIFKGGMRFSGERRIGD